jgi:hypothetical protein
VSIILLESTNSNQSTEGAGDFVSVQNTEVGISQREISVAMDAVFKHHTVTRAVHRLETKASVFRFE